MDFALSPELCRIAQITVAIMKNGRILALGSADELVKKSGAESFESAFVSIVREGK